MSRKGLSKSRLGSKKAAVMILASIIFAIVLASVFTYYERLRQENYVIAIQRINVEAKQLTEHYSNEYSRWSDGLIDDALMVEIVDSIISKQWRLIEFMRGMDVPESYKEAHRYNLLSMEYEYESYRYFKEYFMSKDETNLKKAQELLQLAFENEVRALSLYNGKGLILPQG
jgi:hypothetical protein